MAWNGRGHQVLGNELLDVHGKTLADTCEGGWATTGMASDEEIRIGGVGRPYNHLKISTRSDKSGRHGGLISSVRGSGTGTKAGASGRCVSRTAWHCQCRREAVRGELRSD